MLKYAVLILWRKKGVPANFYAFCISVSVPFLFRTSGKGTDNITKFHMCSHWVWQPCEVMPFCKHIDDTRKSDSFNQVNELKSFGRKFQWNQGEKVWQKRNHRETWDNTYYLKIIATLGAVLVNLVEMWIPSETGIGPLHCQSYARRSNMGKCHKSVLGLKFWSVYIL